MKATNLPNIGSTLAIGAKPNRSEIDRFRGASSVTALGDDALAAQAIVCRTEQLFVSSADDADTRTLVQRFFAQLDQREQPIVQAVMNVCRHPAIDLFRWAMNWIGNGWLYLFAGVALLSWQGACGAATGAGRCGRVGGCLRFLFAAEAGIAAPSPAMPMSRCICRSSRWTSFLVRAGIA